MEKIAETFPLPKNPFSTRFERYPLSFYAVEYHAQLLVRLRTKYKYFLYGEGVVLEVEVGGRALTQKRPRGKEVDILFDVGQVFPGEVVRVFFSTEDGCRDFEGEVTYLWEVDLTKERGIFRTRFMNVIGNRSHQLEEKLADHRKQWEEVLF